MVVKKRLGDTSRVGGASVCSNSRVYSATTVPTPSTSITKILHGRTLSGDVRLIDDTPLVTPSFPRHDYPEMRAPQANGIERKVLMMKKRAPGKSLAFTTRDVGAAIRHIVVHSGCWHYHVYRGGWRIGMVVRALAH